LKFFWPNRHKLYECATTTYVTNMQLGHFYFRVLNIFKSRLVRSSLLGYGCMKKIWRCSKKIREVQEEIAWGGYRNSAKFFCLASIHFLHTCDLLHSWSMPLSRAQDLRALHFLSPYGETSEQQITVTRVFTPSTHIRDGFHGGLGVRPPRSLCRSSPSLSRC